MRGEGTRRVRISADGEDARATGRCPKCNRKPLDVLGRYCVVSDDFRSFIAEAVAQCCGAVIGYLQQFPALKRGELLELETT